jgi:3-hydroxyacyl-[acyl-carrier-protein] dehydratase
MEQNKTFFTQEDIKFLIPHRDKFLLIDEMRDITDHSAVGIHRVRDDEFWCAGHFPGNPVMPGVLQIESLAQTACAVALNNLWNKDKFKGAGYFTNIDDCKFKKIVRPGDVLELEVELIMNRLMLYKFVGKAKVNGEVVSEATFSAILQVEKGEEK